VLARVAARVAAGAAHTDRANVTRVDELDEVDRGVGGAVDRVVGVLVETLAGQVVEVALGVERQRAVITELRGTRHVAVVLTEAIGVTTVALGALEELGVDIVDPVRVADACACVVLLLRAVVALHAGARGLLDHRRRRRRRRDVTVGALLGYDRGAHVGIAVTAGCDRRDVGEIAPIDHGAVVGLVVVRIVAAVDDRDGHAADGWNVRIRRNIEILDTAASSQDRHRDE
jgi:hypothetical protein